MIELILLAISLIKILISFIFSYSEYKNFLKGKEKKNWYIIKNRKNVICLQ